MRHLLHTLLRLSREATAPDISTTLSDAALLHPTAALLSHAWLAPHAAHLAMMTTARRTEIRAADAPAAAHWSIR